MAKEIERKFLLKAPNHTQSWFPFTDGNQQLIVQGYLSGVAICQLRLGPPQEGKFTAVATILGKEESQYWNYYFAVDTEEEITSQVVEDLTFRVRITGGVAYMTIKGKSTEDGLSRDEWEFRIPHYDAREMISSFNLKTIVKFRHKVYWRDLVIELDEFCNENSGLMVAEIEFAEGDPRVTLELDLPEFIGEEVTGDPKYYNSMLMKSPFNTWPKE